MAYVLVVIVMLFCAIGAVRSTRLMVAALWLAGASALLATLIYGLGAPVVAVVELSVGAGLVTVLFVFAISLAGDEPLPQHPVVPKWLAILLAVAFVALLLLFTLPLANPDSNPTPASFNQTFWQTRAIDTLVQVVLIFTAALTVLGLLAERRSRAKSVISVTVQEPQREEQPQ